MGNRLTPPLSTTSAEEVQAAADAIIRIRADEYGGCFRPSSVPEDEIGECADHNCYCVRQAEKEARAALSACPSGTEVAQPSDPEDNLYSDAMDDAMSAFVNTGYGARKNAEQAGETIDGETLARRQVAAAIKEWTTKTPAVQAVRQERERAIEAVSRVATS